MSFAKSFLVWVLLALLGTVSLAVLALQRGESLNAIWLVTAALCVYLIAYRFYSRFIADTVLGLNDRRATPALAP